MIVRMIGIPRGSVANPFRSFRSQRSLSSIKGQSFRRSPTCCWTIARFRSFDMVPSRDKKRVGGRGGRRPPDLNSLPAGHGGRATVEGRSPSLSEAIPTIGPSRADLKDEDRATAPKRGGFMGDWRSQFNAYGLATLEIVLARLRASRSFKHLLYM